MLALHAQSPRFDHINQVRWYAPVTSEVRRRRQEDKELRVILFVCIAAAPHAVALWVTSCHIGTIAYNTGVPFPGGAQCLENAGKTVVSLCVACWSKLLLAMA